MVTSAVAGSYPSACGRPSHLEHHLGGGDVVAVERGEDDVVQRVERAASNRTACGYAPRRKRGVGRAGREG
eukprot:117678-Pleurochrysis_carterae.AAC.1